jgi:hypothetical protein
MIAGLIAGFVTILLGVAFVGTLSEEINTATMINSSLYNSSTWGNTTLKMVPGFYSLGVLAVGIAVCYGALRGAGIV